MEITIAKKLDPLCYLCGRVIAHSAHDAHMRLSMDHIPPKQFFPQPLRRTVSLNLDGAPSHKKCNNDYRKDEDYFYHALYPLVADSNPSMAGVIFSDLMRRATKPQTPALLRRVISSTSGISKGGIILPAGRVEIEVDLVRIQRVAGKIARGVLHLATGICYSESSIVDMRLCEQESEVPNAYQLSWQATSLKGAYPKVFSYRHLSFEEYDILSLVFWEAFMFCITTRKPRSLS